MQGWLGSDRVYLPPIRHLAGNHVSQVRYTSLRLPRTRLPVGRPRRRTAGLSFGTDRGGTPGSRGLSLRAVDGHSVDTTMGFTPTAGLVMASRCGAHSCSLAGGTISNRRSSPIIRSG